MVLVNSYNKELRVETLEEAKEYFKITDNELLEIEDVYAFNKVLGSCEDLFDVCDLLNEFSDISGNGSRYSVVE